MQTEAQDIKIQEKDGELLRLFRIRRRQARMMIRIRQRHHISLPEVCKQIARETAEYIANEYPSKSFRAYFERVGVM